MWVGAGALWDLYDFLNNSIAAVAEEGRGTLEELVFRFPCRF